MHGMPTFLNLKALLVDFDGTLVDSHECLIKAYRNFLQQFDCDGSMEEFEALNGPSLPEVVAFLKQKYQLEGTREELLQNYEEGLVRSYRHSIRALPGVKEALSFAKLQCGIKLALVTSADRKFVDASFEGLKLPFDFDSIVCLEEGMQSKPMPDLYQKALETLDVKPGEAIAIEDGVNGMLAATRAGVFTLLLMDEGSYTEKTIGGVAMELDGGWSSFLELLKGAFSDKLEGQDG